MRVLGIDPGLSGACTMIDMTNAAAFATFDMPTLTEGKKKRVNGKLLKHWIASVKPDYAFIEFVNAKPRFVKGEFRQMPSGSAMQLGDAYATARTVLECLDIDFRRITPKVWKGHFNLPGGAKNKELSRQLAIRKFPYWTQLFRRKMDEARAEAALIALAGIEIYGVA